MKKKGMISFSDAERRSLLIYINVLQHMLNLVKDNVEPAQARLLSQVREGLIELIEMLDKRKQIMEITVVLETDGGIAL